VAIAALAPRARMNWGIVASAGCSGDRRRTSAPQQSSSPRHDTLSLHEERSAQISSIRVIRSRRRR
jgi:hypothetical protein